MKFKTTLIANILPAVDLVDDIIFTGYVPGVSIGYSTVVDTVHCIGILFELGTIPQYTSHILKMNTFFKNYFS